MVLSHCENAKKLGFVAPLLFSYAPGKANRGDSCTLGTRGGAAIAMAALGQAVRGRGRCNKLVFSAFERFVRFSYIALFFEGVRFEVTSADSLIQGSGVHVG